MVTYGFFCFAADAFFVYKKDKLVRELMRFCCRCLSLCVFMCVCVCVCVCESKVYLEKGFFLLQVFVDERADVVSFCR